ncbi:MAG TPA: FAD-dependent oxidoreductase [Xanthobacteraceae bacterium]
MRQSSAYDEEVRDFSPPSAANRSLTCDLLVAGGGLSGLSAAEAALRRGLDVVVIEKGVFGKDAASGLNAGQFLTGWAKPVDIMLAELTQQELRGAAPADQARERAERRVRAFLRRTVEGCLSLAELDRRLNLRASVQRGAVTAAMNEADMASLRGAYEFMEKSSLRALMPQADKRRPPFFTILSARQLARRYGTAEGFYAGGVIDRFGGSFRPRKFLIGLARALQKRGVRLFRQTEAQALDFSDGQVSVFCDNGANIRANMLFMANAYARHINGDALERAIFEYDYVVEVELPEGARTLAAGAVLSDTRDPCFYARRHGRRLYMGYEETAETSPEIVRAVARRTLDEGKRVFPALQGMDERDIRSAWSGRVYYTLDDYPFVERRYGGRVVTFAAPSDHGNALALRIGQLVGNVAAQSTAPPQGDQDLRLRRRNARQLRLFEAFPKGLRLRPGRRYQEAASRPEPSGDAGPEDSHQPPGHARG